MPSSEFRKRSQPTKVDISFDQKTGLFQQPRSIVREGRGRPARTPVAAAARRRPFFLMMKLAPMKPLESSARTIPFMLSVDSSGPEAPPPPPPPIPPHRRTAAPPEPRRLSRGRSTRIPGGIGSDFGRTSAALDCCLSLRFWAELIGHHRTRREMRLYHCLARDFGDSREGGRGGERTS